MTDKGEDEWGCAILIICLIGGVWWWNRSDEPEAAAQLTPVSMESTNTLGSEFGSSVTTPMPVSPPHNYDFVDEGMYGYVAAVSEEDRQRGLATGRLSLVAYRGHEGGVHRLSLFDDAGRLVGDYECAVPCRVIRSMTGDRVARRVAYNPASIIGSAFQDALEGHLAVAPAARERGQKSNASLRSRNANITRLEGYDPGRPPGYYSNDLADRPIPSEATDDSGSNSQGDALDL